LLTDGVFSEAGPHLGQPETRIIAERVAAIRRYLGLTQEQLAEAMRAQGIDWQRVVVAKLENGRRPFVTVDELLGLCVILKISPVDMLVPADVDDDQPYRIVPNGTAYADNAREFIRGEEHLYLYEYPEPVLAPAYPFADPPRVIDSIRWMPADRAQRVDQHYDDSWIEEEERKRWEEEMERRKAVREGEDPS
jgi:transcriptional regulator with XRE-family HTH domain